MSGFIENTWDKYCKARIIKLYPALGSGGEWALGMQHFWQMLAVTMGLNFLAAMTSKWVFILTPLSAVLIAIAEWPPYGRMIDIITRGSGWLAGSIIAIICFMR